MVASNWDDIVQIIPLDGTELKERDQCPEEYTIPDNIRAESLAPNLTMVSVYNVYCVVYNIPVSYTHLTLPTIYSV